MSVLFAKLQLDSVNGYFHNCATSYLYDRTNDHLCFARAVEITFTVKKKKKAIKKKHLNL